MKVIVLQQNKEAYEPSSEEIHQYGQYLGLKFPQDQRFCPLLYEALKAPLPQDWEACETIDQNKDLMYRNKKTQNLQYQHPLDNFYKQKITKLKSLTENLQIQTILQEKESWLKESSQYFGKSKDSKQVQYLNEQNKQFIDQIEEQKSIYDSDLNQQTQKSSLRQQYGVVKSIKSTHNYIKTRKSTPKNIKQELKQFNFAPTFTYNEIKNKIYPVFTTFQQNSKVKELQQLNNNVQSKKSEYQQLQYQRIRKLQYIQQLKNQIKLNQKFFQ